MTNENVMRLIRGMSTPEMQAFLKKLIPSKIEILGMRSPDIHSLAKRIVKGEFGEPIKIAEDLPPDIYECLMLKGEVMNKIKMPDDERRTFIDGFVPYIDNWANNDAFVASMKFVNKNLDEWYDYFCGYALSDSEFKSRFGILSLMYYYLDDKHIDGVLSILQKVNCDAYYAKMAVAWTVATALYRYYGKTLRLLENKNLSVWTHNKSIQKAVESYRITNEQKAYLKSLKIK